MLRRMSALAGLLLLAASCGTPIVDARDGRSYPTVAIGGQCWMALNLDHGVVVADAMPRDASAVEKSCYGNDPGSCRTYGGLYTWDEARQACPAGWHLPSREEWETLAAHLGTATAGEKLKARKDHVPAFDGTDEVGFTALPAGTAFRGAFGRQGDWGVFWTATENGPERAVSVTLDRLWHPAPPRYRNVVFDEALPEGERVLGALPRRRSARVAGDGSPTSLVGRAPGQAGRPAFAGALPSQRRGLRTRTVLATLVPAGRRQNVLCVVCEDISPLLGSYGDPVALTPSSTGSRARACGSPACSRAPACARRAGPP